jgi:hypothetical protein
MPKDKDPMVRGPRQMALDLLQSLIPDFPVAKGCDSMGDLARWAQVTLEDLYAYSESKMSRTTVVRLPDAIIAPRIVALSGRQVIAGETSHIVPKQDIKIGLIGRITEETLQNRWQCSHGMYHYRK